MARKKAKLTRAKRGTLSKSRKSARAHYIRSRAKRLAYAKKYYRKNRRKILARRKRYHKLTRGTPFYKSGKAGGRWPRGKRKKYAKRTRTAKRRRA